ncbi:MAG: metallopeptidase family protein [Propionibacteriales bacterium]|nr:metallopeptidase family protein [Propionibacteriales bacterium]
MSAEAFDAAVDRALDQVPDELWELISNCVVLVADAPPPAEPELLGLYDGIPLTERDSGYSGVLPDRIFIYRSTTLAMCESVEEVVDEITVTVVHEIAHHFGIDDRRLDELGYA